MDTTTHHVLPLLRQATPVQQALSPSSSTTRTKQEAFPSPHKTARTSPQGTNRRVLEKEKTHTHAAYTTQKPDKLTLTDGASVARRRRDAHVIMVAGACCYESLWVGGCVWAGRRIGMLRRRTRSWLVHCECLGVPIGSETTVCARSAPLLAH